MKTFRVEITTQIEPENQGFAPDDHLDKECYDLLLTEEVLTLVTPLLAKAMELANNHTQQLDSDWLTKNPGKECNFNGQEFVGSTWIYKSTLDEPPNYPSTTEDLLARLGKVIESHENRT